MKKYTLSLILLLCFLSTSFAQSYHVQGCVADSSGNPIEAATVLLLQKGVVVNGAITDVNGFYSIYPVDSAWENVSVMVEYMYAKSPQYFIFSHTNTMAIDFMLNQPNQLYKDETFCGECFPNNLKWKKDEVSGSIWEGEETRRMAGFGN